MVKEIKEVAIEEVIKNVAEFIEIPTTTIVKSIKNANPELTMIQKDAKAALTKACTVFIHYLSASAMDIAKLSNNRTLLPQHIFKALETLELEELVPSVQQDFDAYKEALKAKKAAAKEAKKSKADGSTEIMKDDEEKDDDEMDGNDSTMDMSETSPDKKRKAEDDMELDQDGDKVEKKLKSEDF